MQKYLVLVCLDFKGAIKNLCSQLIIMHLDVINCKPKVRFFNHNIQPVKNDFLKNRRHWHWFGARSSCGSMHANRFPTELLCNVAIARNLSLFFGSPVFRIKGIHLGRCPEMQSHEGEETQTASNQTPVSSRRQAAPDCYKRHDLFCPETILRLNIIQT